MVQTNGRHAFGYNSAKTEPIWLKAGTVWAKCWANGWGLAVADFGRDPRSSDSLRGRRNFASLVRWITHDFTDFPSDKFYDISTRQRRSVRRWKLSEENIKNFTIRGRFSEKMQNCSQNFQVLRFQAVITPQWLQKPKTQGQMVPLRMSSFHFYC